jgi:hypothetical protein
MCDVDLNDAIGELWGGIIDSLEFDYFNHLLTLKIRIIDNEIESHHTLQIKNICGFLWINDSGIFKYQLEGPPYKELTSIHYNETIKEIVKIDADWCSQYRLTPNFALEIWEQILLVEASEIELDGIRWEVKFHELDTDNESIH